MNKYSEVEVHVARQDERISAIEQRFTDLERTITEGFSSVNEKLDKVIQSKEEAHIRINKDLSSLANEITRVDTRTNTVASLVAAISVFISAVAAYFSHRQ